MPQRLSLAEAGFETAFEALVSARREADEDVHDVTTILKRVRAEGDIALADYTAYFDGHDLEKTGWSVSSAECEAALASLSTELRDALILAADRITTYNAKQKPADSDDIDDAGVRLDARWTPVDAAGLAVSDYVAGPNYVMPTGRRARFSSGLSVFDFMKRTSFLALTEGALAAIGPATVALADAERLPAHDASVARRLDQVGGAR